MHLAVLSQNRQRLALFTSEITYLLSTYFRFLIFSYDDAKELLEKMGGNEVPDEWKGGITGVKYSLGGVMNPPELKVRLSTHNYFGTVKSSNVIGYIRGAIEPDRYVFLSNHRDAWGYGAVDPSSGQRHTL